MKISILLPYKENYSKNTQALSRFLLMVLTNIVNTDPRLKFMEIQNILKFI